MVRVGSREQGFSPLLLYPRVGGRSPAGKDQDGIPITNVGSDNSFRSYPQVVAGSHLETVKMNSRLQMSGMRRKIDPGGYARKLPLR